MSNVKTSQENKMGTMPVGRLLATMAIPMMISMLVQAFYNVVDSVYVSELGKDAINALSYAFPLQNLMIAVGSGTAVGMNAILSRALGAKKQDEVDRIANTGIFLFLCSSLVFAFIGIFLARPYMSIITDNAKVIEYGTDYVSICLGLSVGIFCQFCFERLLQSTGRTSICMVTQMAGAITNIILDPLLIKGTWIFPRLEVKGAAIATITGQIIAAILALVFNFVMNPDIHIKLKMIRLNVKTAFEIYKIAFPSIIMLSIGSVMTFTMNKILLTFEVVGETATAVFGIYFKLQSFIFMPIFGLNNGMIPIIAYNYGARRPDRIKKTILLSLISAVGLMAVGFALFEIIPGVLLGFFKPDDNMLEIGKTALRIIGFHYLLAGFCIISISVCQAIGNPLHCLIVSVCRQLVVLIPAAFLLSLAGNLSLVWLAFPIAEMVSLILSLLFLRGTLKKISALKE